MSPEFKKCLERGKIKKFSPGPRLATKEIRLANEDRQAAIKSMSEGNMRWSIIQAYYSMFHSARALLYSRGFRERSHYCLIEAVRDLFVKAKKLDPLLLEALQEAKTLREEADYYGDFSELNCRKTVKKAEKFFQAAAKIVKNK
jgi:uncharacterized protein (UPF0332 family)